MRIRKKKRPTDGIPNGPPRPSIDRLIELVEQLNPRERWLFRLRLRDVYVQRPRPVTPAQPETKLRRKPGLEPWARDHDPRQLISKEEFEARLLAQVNEGRAKRGYPLIEDWEVKSRQRPRKKKAKR